LLSQLTTDIDTVRDGLPSDRQMFSVLGGQSRDRHASQFLKSILAVWLSSGHQKRWMIVIEDSHVEDVLDALCLTGISGAAIGVLLTESGDVELGGGNKSRTSNSEPNHYRVVNQATNRCRSHLLQLRDQTVIPADKARTILASSSKGLLA
jgi:hypothetical protein